MAESSVSGEYLGATAPDHYRYAVYFIFGAFAFDSLDGRLARLGGRESLFGAEFDSVADVVSFGVAPALLMYFLILSPSQGFLWFREIGPFVGFVYLLCAAMRLARFNVITAEMGPNLFLGLPSTLSGGLICSAFLTIHELGLESPALYRLFPALLVLNAALMVSNLPLPKLHLSAHPAAKGLQVGAAVAVYVTVLARTGFTFVLALLLGYLAFGFAVQGPRMWRERQQQG